MAEGWERNPGSSLIELYLNSSFCERSEEVRKVWSSQAHFPSYFLSLCDVCLVTFQSDEIKLSALAGHLIAHAL